MAINAKPQILKQININLIRDVLRKKITATRAELVKITGISTTTVRALLSELIESKDVICLGFDKSSGGRPAERYSINKDKDFIINFAIGDDYIDYRIVNILGEIIEQGGVANNNQDYIFDLINDKLHEDINLVWVGVSVPGIPDGEKYYTGCKFLECKEHYIGRKLKERFQLPVILENDINSCALGFSKHYIKNSETGLNVVYINFVKNGIGCGIISNNRLIRGFNNYAGELIYLPVDTDKYLDSLLQADITDEQYTDMITNIIATMSCIINPEFFVLAGVAFRFHLIEKIKEKSKNMIPIGALPKIFISKNDRDEALTGISSLILEKVYSDVKIYENLEDL